MQGWICGRCNASVAPWAAMCPGCSPSAGQAPVPQAQGASPFPGQYHAPPAPAPEPTGPPRFERGSFPIGARAPDPASEVIVPKSGGSGGIDKAGDVTLDSDWLS